MKKVINVFGWLCVAMFLLLMFAPNPDAPVEVVSQNGHVKYQRQSILYRMNKRLQDNVINGGLNG
jgi:hypothetical protein